MSDCTDIQEACPHQKDYKSTFDKGICSLCGFVCEHEESEDGACLDCGESTFDPDYADYLYEQERDRRLENDLEK